jgi:hypothetical protein
LRQWYLAHKTRNVTDKVPDSRRAEIKKAPRATYYVPNREMANMITAEVLKTHQQLVFATLWRATQR